MAVIKNIPIGLVLPLRNGPKSGYFDQSFDSFTAYRMNIINLLRTMPGERRMNPTFGCRLWEIVFDQNDDLIPKKVEKIIGEDISLWIPGVSVSEVIVHRFNDGAESIRDIDMYKLHIAVRFVVEAINQEDVVEIILNTGKI